MNIHFQILVIRNSPNFTLMFQELKLEFTPDGVGIAHLRQRIIHNDSNRIFVLLSLGLAIASPNTFSVNYLEVTIIFYIFATDKVQLRVAGHVKTSMEQRPKAICKAGLEGRFRTLSSAVSTSQLETHLEDNRNEAST